MKTKTITLLKKELLIVEPPKSWGLTIGDEYLLIYDHEEKTFGKTYTFKGSYTLLGKPDEIKEEYIDEDLVRRNKTGRYKNYQYLDKKLDDFGLLNALLECPFKTALESFNSALESEIYWENPIEKPKETNLSSSFFDMQVSFNQQVRFDEAESHTFDQNRTLIFIKNSNNLKRLK